MVEGWKFGHLRRHPLAEQLGQPMRAARRGQAGCQNWLDPPQPPPSWANPLNVHNLDTVHFSYIFHFEVGHILVQDQEARPS